MSFQRKVGIIELYCPLIDYLNYAVSNYGNVKNIKTDRILKPGINGSGYLHVILMKDNIKYTKRVHKLVLPTFEANPENKKCIDHIDNNKLNNELFNLRFATSQENNQNSSICNRNTSGTKGVTFKKSNNKWVAYIGINSKDIHIGYYNNIEDAINARREKSKELFGEYLNSCEK